MCLSLAVRNGVNREGRTMLEERHEKPRLQVPRTLGSNLEVGGGWRRKRGKGQGGRKRGR
jgi:hypothetical protein